MNDSFALDISCAFFFFEIEHPEPYVGAKKILLIFFFLLSTFFYFWTDWFEAFFCGKIGVVASTDGRASSTSLGSQRAPRPVPFPFFRDFPDTRAKPQSTTVFSNPGPTASTRPWKQRPNHRR